MNNKLINVCCLPDTSAISCILSSQDNKLNIHEEERINSLRILKEEINDFVISALVIHELVLGLEEKYLKDDAFIIIMNYIKSYFNSLKIEPLGTKSLKKYREIYNENKFLNKDRAKHKVDTLIIANASCYAELNADRYSDFWFLTEDKTLLKYKVNNLKIYSLSDAVKATGRLI